MPFLRLKLPNQTEEITCVLDGARITIGRGPTNTIQIAEPSVSAHHAELIMVRGHYRLHDLDSTNLTCVDGRPVSDFHLHVPCRLRFGNVEADFSPESPPESEDQSSAVAPTQSEIDFLKRDNRDLQAKVATLQRQLEILGKVPLMPMDQDRTSISIEAHRRIVSERDALLRENAALKRDIDTILRDRDALRVAWATARADLAGVAV